MMEYNQLLNLACALAKANPENPIAYSFENVNYSYEALQEALREEINSFAGDFYSFEENKITLFKLMADTVDQILPKIVTDRYQAFAEIKTVPQGTRVFFKRKTGKARAKKTFVTKVGLAGLYDTFKLGSETFEVEMGAIGSAAQIGLEEWLDGNADFNDLLEVIMEGMDEAVYKEIAGALKTTVDAFSETTVGRNRKYVTKGFNERAFDQLIQVTESYGPATIYCTAEFAAKILPKDPGWAPESAKMERWVTGYCSNYKGHRVIILPQSFDEGNVEKQINPQYCYIIPGTDKPVKLAFEGQTIMDEFKNNDRSREIQVYKKFGIAVICHPGMTAYQDTDIPTQYDNGTLTDGHQAITDYAMAAARVSVVGTVETKDANILTYIGTVTTTTQGSEAISVTGGPAGVITANSVVYLASTNERIGVVKTDAARTTGTTSVNIIKDSGVTLTSSDAVYCLVRN